MKTSFALRVSALVSVIFTLVVLHDTAYATVKKRKPTQTDGAPVHVIVLDPDIDTRKIDRRAVVHDRSGNPIEVIDPMEREEFFRYAHLTQEVAGWDSLDRDLLVISAQTLKQKELNKKYPNIVPAKLKKLAQLLKGRAKSNEAAQ